MIALGLLLAFFTHLPSAQPVTTNYQLVFRQTVPYMYAQDELRLNAEDPTSDNYAILDELERFRREDGRLYFRMVWPGDDTVYEWSQTSNPVFESVEGYEAINVPFTGKYWGGLEPSTAALMDGSVNRGDWFYAIGSHGLWHGGIPSYAKSDSDNAYPQQAVELYVAAIAPTMAPTTGACTEEFCASRAAEMDLPFQSVHKSNGAPRGCVMYKDRVTWARNCVNHPNCGTTNCNGCEVIAACPATGDSDSDGSDIATDAPTDPMGDGDSDIVTDAPTRYIGCFVDSDASRDLPVNMGRDHWTMDTCGEACQRYAYFAYQDGANSNGPVCFCGNDYATQAQYVQVEDSECEVDGEMRGGNFRNAIYNNPASLEVIEIQLTDPANGHFLCDSDCGDSLAFSATSETIWTLRDQTGANDGHSITYENGDVTFESPSLGQGIDYFYERRLEFGAAGSTHVNHVWSVTTPSGDDVSFDQICQQERVKFYNRRVSSYAMTVDNVSEFNIQCVSSTESGIAFRAYWEGGSCGPDGNDANWEVCGERDGVCPEYVTWTQCASGQAQLHFFSRDWIIHNPGEAEACHFEWYAEYICADSTSPCEPSHEWSMICDDCSCETWDDVSESAERIDTFDACKAYAENHGYDNISFQNGKCRVAYEMWCSNTEQKDGWETHKLTVEECPLDTTVWSNMNGFDSICSKGEHHIDVRVDQSFYNEKDKGYVHEEDCNTLCGSVGSFCLDGWKVEQNEMCPVEIKNPIGCSSRNSESFVCSCALIDSDPPSQKSKVINYDDCTSAYSLTADAFNFDIEVPWPSECPANTAVVSVETRAVERSEKKWTIMGMQCCGLVDKVTDAQNCNRIPEIDFEKSKVPTLTGGGNWTAEEQWDAQCGPNGILLGIFDDDTKGDFDDIDAVKCCTLDTPFTSGEKIDHGDCAVVNLSPNSKSTCPLDYVMVGIYDDAVTQFERVRKMKCCRVLESILPTVSPTQMPTTDEPSQSPTQSPTTSIPSMSPTTEEPTVYPSQNPTTDRPTSTPSVSPSSGPTKFPSTSPSTDEPTLYPSYTPSLSPSTGPTKVPSTSPSTDEPTLYPSQNPTTDRPTSTPSVAPSTGPTKFPSTSPTTEEPTAFPSTAPTNAPTVCEPTCRSHTDQMMNILGRLLVYIDRTSDDPLKNELSAMILDFHSLQAQLEKRDDQKSTYTSVY